MNRLLFIILLFILNHCSFDNKTGIWKNSSIIDIEKKKRFEDFKTLYTEEKTFNSIIEPPENLNLLIDPIKTTNKWPDEFYRNSNNLDNFSYKDLNNLIFKSKKLSKHKISKKILFDGENIIVSDIKGNIIVYSLEKKQTIYKYNFYKKKFKKIIKNINITIKAGSRVAFVGKTGSGKSTLIDLIMSLIFPTSGKIFVDGKDLNESNKFIDYPSIRNSIKPQVKKAFISKLPSSYYGKACFLIQEVCLKK